MATYNIKAPIGTVKLLDLLPLFCNQQYRNRAEYLVCRGYFGKVKRKGTSKDSITFVPEEGAERIRMLASNLKNLEELVVLSKASEETKIPLQSLRHLFYSNGKQYTLYEELNLSKYSVLGYKKSKAKERFVEPKVPYLVWVPGTNKYLTRGVTDMLKQAIIDLKTKESFSFDCCWYYKLGDWIKENRGLYLRKQKITKPQEKIVKKIVPRILSNEEIDEKLFGVFKCGYNWFGRFREYVKDHGVGGAKVDWENLPNAKILRIELLKMIKSEQDSKEEISLLIEEGQQGQGRQEEPEEEIEDLTSIYK